jgi:hypothetical protein
VLWSKACNAAGVYGVSVLGRVSAPRLFRDPDLIRAYLGLVRETAALAGAHGVPVGDYTSFPRPASRGGSACGGRRAGGRAGPGGRRPRRPRPGLGCLASGLWIPFALGTAGVLALVLTGYHTALSASLASIAWNTVDNFVLTSVPLFLLMGEVVLQAGLTTRFYRGLAVWLDGLRGGLLHCNVVGAAIFSAVCGSSAATAAAMGTVAIPEMLRRRYDPPMVYGTVAAGGALGNLIPPASPRSSTGSTPVAGS